ncbi:DUF4173 domain-containing protein [Flavobacterium sp. AED]|uniref:DUF4153 domain-containing protein n=1 Tax=Flavobacterium sp. AED TaxID=1423323 RepID=UPI0005800ED7|nr:DUF4173 domain-containing protein [Flavobacterium sp. AED]KIA85193.1 hypothetical protein OA85_12365 [Flavobacterium sp. AED]MDI1306934.1 DUF4173 domain-containing protein [bacterium]
MKKHHLILACSMVFTLLFYKETVGVNLAIFGLVLTGMICYFFQERFTSRLHLGLVITSILSCSAFAWYGDFVSVLALSMSVLFLQFKTHEVKLKIVQIFPIVFINGFASLGRILMFSQWLPKKEIKNDFAKKLIAYFIIPALFITVFFVVYAFGSEHFSSLFTDYTLDLDVLEVFLIALLGFYISFSFWNYWVPDICYDFNSKLDNDFSSEARMEHQQTFSFLDLDFERKSGEITLVLLNCMILIFIGTYNYEQFFEENVVASLSAATHERVNAVIFSIIMAVGVMLFFFKNGFNFDKKARHLKLLSKIWIALNGVLIISTIIKNIEYVAAFGLTYKRLGVFAFLLLAIVGLLITFWKIYKQKTNAYLFNKMIWCFYGTILLCSFINWGNIITNYNISVNKGVEPIFLSGLNFNDETRRDYFLLKKLDGKEIELSKEEQISDRKSEKFLSKALYYEFITKK